MNTLQKDRLYKNATFRTIVRVQLIAHVTDVLHEVPAELTFGSEQANVEATGRLAEAQAAMHDKRHLFAMNIQRSPNSYAEQAALTLASKLVEEVTAVNPTLGAMVGGYALLLIGDATPPLYDPDTAPDEPTVEQYQAAFELAVQMVIEQGFSSAAGYNTHTDPFR